MFWNNVWRFLIMSGMTAILHNVIPCPDTGSSAFAYRCPGNKVWRFLVKPGMTKLVITLQLHALFA